MNALLFGDGTGTLDTNQFDGDAGPSPESTNSDGFDASWGAGKFKSRRLDGAGMGAPWGWGTGNLWLWDGDTIDVPIASGPLPSGVDRVVLAAAWDEPHLSPWQTSTAAAHIELSIVYTTPVNGTCPNPNGGFGSALATDDSLDTHKRLELDNPWTFWYGGRCFWQRYRAVDVPNDADGRAPRARLEPPETQVSSTPSTLRSKLAADRWPWRHERAMKCANVVPTSPTHSCQEPPDVTRSLRTSSHSPRGPRRASRSLRFGRHHGRQDTGVHRRCAVRGAIRSVFRVRGRTMHEDPRLLRRQGLPVSKGHVLHGQCLPARVTIAP